MMNSVEKAENMENKVLSVLNFLQNIPENDNNNSIIIELLVVFPLQKLLAVQIQMNQE